MENIEYIVFWETDTRKFREVPYIRNGLIGVEKEIVKGSLDEHYEVFQTEDEAYEKYKEVKKIDKYAYYAKQTTTYENDIIVAIEREKLREGRQKRMEPDFMKNSKYRYI